MAIVNIHEAKTQLSRLIERALAGESMVIAKAGKPLVKLVRLDAPDASRIRRLGFLVGEIQVPEEFDRMGADEIDAMFGGMA
ncbi:type II toxin-antitoxin system prevent-host-death family antitoxin [Luteimonas sp. MC1782]|uniref:type II toxin-antitoxin system Phd/YefM family antitoxin n=1 Tax=Luteimonas sp. MC1782 TaxID=2760305 RepID=UPI0016031EA2|nr:type II toxin-antitoxin system prevent-host-death family antitoxin [Luteimonas sp. MC1782]MBB1472209.1 type II toxin-antitoxin system prevent-host-death family antitoxin [Luteimonas sp. MC1782]